MTDIFDDDDDDERAIPVEGLRKDGKPFRANNLRDDGSYEVGKGRPPAQHRFAKGDGRKRGKRPKGGKNLDTVWRKELNEKRTIDNRTRSTLEWTVEGLTRRAITKSDRAAELVLARAEQLERRERSRLGLTDQQIIDAWFADRIGGPEGTVSDDADNPSVPDPEAGDGDQ